MHHLIIFRSMSGGVTFFLFRNLPITLLSGNFYMQLEPIFLLNIALVFSLLYLFSSRKKPMGLIVALGEDGKTEGELFWDDGESIGETPCKCEFLLYSSLNINI